jgi:23S rRNA (uridine2552-2'-O)-methyltransferase
VKPGNKPDPFTAKAHKEGFAARSIYKLEEIDRRIRLTRPGLRVLDLGAAPGSWTQYLANKVGPRGLVVALDLNPLKVAVPKHVRAAEVDILACPLSVIAEHGPFDLVVSDMAPHTSGVREADVARSVELVERVIAIADAALKKGGVFLAKIFQGDGFEEVRASLRERYETVRVLKPEASRKESFEIYLAGLSHKRDPVVPGAPPPDAPAPPTETKG